MHEPPRPLDRWHRAAALGGIVGVAGFVGAWVAGGMLRAGYSPIDDAISQLAAVGAPRRWLMNLGFVTFGIGVPIYARALRRAVPGPAWIAATTAGVATLGVTAAPLGAADGAHNIAALVGYAALAATPLLAASSFAARGSPRWALSSRVCGTLSVALLIAASFDPVHGLTQRGGLAVTDAWIVATAWTMWRTGGLTARTGTDPEPAGATDLIG